MAPTRRRPTKRAAARVRVRRSRGDERRASTRGPGPADRRLRRARLRVLGEVDGVVLYLVSGEQVRDVDIDFTMGGNGAVYAYVPVGEVWIDDAAHVLDRTTTALHELVERDLMLRRRMGYDRAHEVANVHERVFRRRLLRRRPASFDLEGVADAYRGYLADAGLPRSRRAGASGPRS